MENKEELFKSNTVLNKDIELGMEFAKLKDRYNYKKIVDCVKGDLSDTYGVFEILKPLYDKYGYGKINKLILEFEKEKGAEDE